jgi:hypothetical protein
MESTRNWRAIEETYKNGCDKIEKEIRIYLEIGGGEKKLKREENNKFDQTVYFRKLYWISQAVIAVNH